MIWHVGPCVPQDQNSTAFKKETLVCVDVMHVASGTTEKMKYESGPSPV